jgi:hypothetical protein
MPRTGLAYCMAAVYNYNQSTGAITYSDGGYIGRMVSVNIQKADNNDNDWHGDNVVGETDSAFGGGSVELQVGEISVEASEAYFGLEVVDLADDDAIPGVTDTDAKKILYKANGAVPYVGLGTVVTERIKGTGENAYVGVVLTKTQLTQPDTEVTTKGRTIDWQNITVRGRVFQDDKADPDWKIESSPLSTMAQALAFVRHFLNIPNPAQSNG